MSKILKLTGFTTLSTLLGASYYYYVVDQPLYQQTQLYQTNEKVQSIIDNKLDIEQDHMSLEPQVVLLTPFSETLKDLWNREVRNSAEWLYSWGK